MDTFKRISYDDLKIQKEIPTEIVSDVIFNRPDCLAAEKMLEKAGIDTRIAKKEFLPTFSIVGLIAPFTTSSLSSMSWNTAIAGAGINAVLPLFTGGRKIANLKIKQNKYKQMFEEYKKTSLVAVKEVHDSLSNLQLDNEKYEKNLNAYKIEQKNYTYAQQRYDKGVISNLDLIQRKEVLLSTEKLAVSSNIEKQVSYISLYKATSAHL